MVKHDLKTFGFVIIGFALVTWITLIWIHHGYKLDKISIEDLGSVSSVVSINVLFWGFFIKYFWKWPIFRGWLIQVPDLSGEWEGEVMSAWVNDEGQKLQPINAKVIISQSLFHVNIKLKTAEMESNSSASSLDIDAERGYKNLWYSYRSEPKANVRVRSNMHHGSVLLRINDSNDMLEGQYWTDRQSIGDMVLRKIKK